MYLNDREHRHIRFSASDDKIVRLYDASADSLRGEFLHGGPVLDCCFHDDSSGFSASDDNTVRRIVFSHGKEDIFGRHDFPVRCIEYLMQQNSVMPMIRITSWECTKHGQGITGSWDKTLKCWDPRGASGKEKTLVGTYLQPERVYSLSLVGNRLVVATAGRHVNVYDLRNMSQPEQRRESSLKLGYALSSVEGRVAMEFFDLSEASQAKKYAQEILSGSLKIINIVFEFRRNYGTFATGGCDGFVNVWDGTIRRGCIRLVTGLNCTLFYSGKNADSSPLLSNYLLQYSKYPTSIAALSFSRDGRLLAVASSYTFEEGDKPHEPDAIFVRSVNEIEVKPKPKVYPNPPT
ncbi:Mitotic checkpoint protein BUB3.2 [Hibiscus syriacus]|uniref:Mitotic checkpoint protein BUB3.2 n=1 Tax=Hibiscus syriacus TaxID=106335 RepID=A0A6A3CAN9_HIBSY|nr:Mitotic checkpoint protein BUB3.2 [Hibiscus syriacus]